MCHSLYYALQEGLIIDAVVSIGFTPPHQFYEAISCNLYHTPESPHSPSSLAVKGLFPLGLSNTRKSRLRVDASPVSVSTINSLRPTENRLHADKLTQLPLSLIHF